MARLVLNEPRSKETHPPLTGADRCDRCGAAAKMRALLEGGELMFCRHHGEEYLPRLVDVALDIFIEPLD